MTPQEMEKLERQYRDALLNDCIPFWLGHSLDRECGGYFHQLDFDGAVIDTDKYMWPQNRQVWIFSMLYNQLDSRAEWLDTARLGVDFLKKHGRDPNGDWYFALNRCGEPVIAPYNIFSDFFAVIAFAEYGLAAGDDEALDIAFTTFDRIQKRKDNPKGRWTKTLPAAPRMKNLAIPMINLNTALVLNRVRERADLNAIVEAAIREVMTDFLDRDRDIVFEYATPDGLHPDTLLGRQLTPGHGIESMWFIMRAAHMIGDAATVQRACEVTLSLIDFGWDAAYEGIYYFMDVDGKPHIELHWDMKLWWVHLETLIALILGYQLTGEHALLDAFMRVHDYTWDRYPDPEHGEWFGYLNRQGQVNNRCKANRWKCCFHVPRAFFEISTILHEIRTRADGASPPAASNSSG